MKVWKYLLIIVLIAILILIFVIQEKLFTQEMNSIPLGIATLLAVLTLEIISHVFMFKSTQRVAKIAFGIISVLLITFASFVNFAVMTSLSINKNKEISINSLNSDTEYQKLIKDKKLISNRITSIDNQIKAKYDIINSIKDTKSRWMINKLNNDIRKLNQLWTKEQNKLSSLKAIYKKHKEEGIINILEEKTKIPAINISTFNKVFLSILLSIIPLSLCYLLLVPFATSIPSHKKGQATFFNSKKQDTSQPPKNKVVKQYRKPQKLNNIENQYPYLQSGLVQTSNKDPKDRKPIYIDELKKIDKEKKKELASKLRVSTRYLDRLIESGTMPSLIENKFNNLYQINKE